MPYRFRPALPEDAVAIAELMLPESASRGGALWGDFPADRIRHWLERNLEDQMPVLLAEDPQGLVAVLFTTASHRQDGPLPAIMARLHQGQEPFYFYGPVCIAPRARGQGVLEGLKAELDRRLPGLKAVLFIQAGNAPSLKAHQRLGLSIEARFEHQGQVFELLHQP